MGIICRHQQPQASTMEIVTGVNVFQVDTFLLAFCENW